ncbi:EH signature domain-containing protein [Vibrio agarivorans]|uniref:EH signature domain-containing protein n=1 Tax=Vibrio agarivorans TaxID=153622 RepID=UPI0025B3E293|nr:EH signature domain-containing protein [Vibrio agarivorans]MDN3663379.1 EH signature domain-containing protein [Vibrio agarivorans]
MSSSGFSFSQPRLPSSNKLTSHSFDEFLELGITDDRTPSFPPKTLMQIVALVSAQRSDEVHVFEWLEAIESEVQWKNLNEQERERACVAVWTGVGSQLVLGDIALFKMGLALDGKATSVVSELVESIDIARTVPIWSAIDQAKLDWLLALKTKDFDEMASLCYQGKQTLSGYIKFLRLPQANSYKAELANCLLSPISDGNLSDFDDVWLANNFYALDTTQQRVDFCERFIGKLEQFDYGDQCAEIIENHCFPLKKNSYWPQLGGASKAVLKKKFGLTSYFDLHAISAALYSEEAAIQLDFNDYQTRQIRSRSKFWSNYSSRFERVRVLLPSESYNWVESQNGGLPEFVHVLPNSTNTDSEIYIFELDNLLVVEFLRGTIAETRFYKKSDWNTQKLFDSEALTSEDIRTMTQLEVHDHLDFWQHYCEKLLRTKFKVLPNNGTKSFKGLSKALGQYSESRGLPKPDEGMVQKRKASLETWIERFWEAEVKTGKFGELRGLAQKSTLYLSKAIMAKQLGNQADYELFIKKAANQGNPEAMWQLGKNMLLGTNSDARTRKYGEDWVSKAASCGHQEAMETANRFRISFQDSMKGSSRDSSAFINGARDKAEWDEMNRERSRYLKSKHQKEEKNYQETVDVLEEVYKPSWNNRDKEEWSSINRARAKRLREKFKVNEN